MADVKFLKKVLRILGSLERRLANESLARPVRTDVVTQPHDPAMRAPAKLLADVFCSMMLYHGWDEKCFAKVAGFMGMNLSHIPAAEIVGSEASSVPRPLAFAWILRRAESDDPRLNSYYDRNVFEESLDYVACNSVMLQSAVHVRERRIVISSRLAMTARQALDTALHVFTEVQPDFSTYDKIKMR